MAAPAARKPRISTAPPIVITDAPDQIWAVNFHDDVTTAGWPITIGPIVEVHPSGTVKRTVTGEHPDR